MIRVLATFDGRDDLGGPVAIDSPYAIYCLNDWLRGYIRRFGFDSAWARCRFVRVPEDTA